MRTSKHFLSLLEHKQLTKHLEYYNMEKTVTVKSYRGGNIKTTDEKVTVSTDKKSVLFMNEIYKLVGTDGPDYQYQSGSLNVIKIGIDEV